MNANIPAANREVGAKDNVKGSGQDEKIDYAAIEVERMEREYAGLVATHDRLRSEAAAIPTPINDDATALRAGGVIKAMRDLRASFENARVVEVEPHLRRQNGINTFCKGHTEALQPDDKNKRRVTPGEIDVLQGEINAHQDRKEAAERARLEEERRVREAAERAAREERERQERIRLKAEQEARDAEAAAARARSEEQRRKRQLEAEEANRRAAEAAAAQKQAEVKVERAAEQSQDARIATLAPTKDIVHTKGTTQEGGGVVLTTATEKYALVEDRGLFTDETKLALFDFFNDAEVAKAVRAYANSVRHMKTLPGCSIGVRKAGVTR